jgi:hypothetical protein
MRTEGKGATFFPEFSPNFKPIIEVKPYSWPDENPQKGPLIEANSS